jgi:hypothetical protein
MRIQELRRFRRCLVFGKVVLYPSRSWPRESRGLSSRRPRWRNPEVASTQADDFLVICSVSPGSLSFVGCETSVKTISDIDLDPFEVFDGEMPILRSGTPQRTTKKSPTSVAMCGGLSNRRAPPDTRLIFRRANIYMWHLFNSLVHAD